MSHPLLELQRLRQSPWHDNIRRELLTSGKLAAMIADGDVTGLTSNPTIFEQAIAKSTDYDADLEALAREGKTAEEIFDRLSRDDVQSACDLFREIYDRTQGQDGFCSIEVAPKHARDTETTIAEAKRLWGAIDRPNLMVKIPATREGVPAIEATIAAGVNVNVTLIFSLPRYEEVMNAYLRGLIRRSERDQPIDRVASVASFFVSRVDGAVDRLLEEKISRGEGDRAHLESLRGRAAIANAKLAYEAFRRKRATEGWATLAMRGAQVQRPLWASTSTKNPDYPDVYYVEALVGPDTVDTMPPQTLVAYKDHGRPEPRLMQEMDEAERVMNDLAALGIDMGAVTEKLEEDGVAAFAKSFDSLIALVEDRRRAALAPRTEPAAEPPAVAPADVASIPPPTAKAPSRRAGPKARAKTEPRSAKRSPTRAARKPKTGSAAKAARKAKAPKKAVAKGKKKPAKSVRRAKPKRVVAKTATRRRAKATTSARRAKRANPRKPAKPTSRRKPAGKSRTGRAPARTRATKPKTVRGAKKPRRTTRPARKKG